MAIDKSDVQPGERRTNLLARYPLTFYFIIALGGTLIRRPWFPVMPSSLAFSDTWPKKDVTSAGFCH